MPWLGAIVAMLLLCTAAQAQVPSPVTVPISVHPALTFNPTQLNFGLTPDTKSVTLTNASPWPLPVSIITINGVNPTDFSQTNNCLSSIPSGGSCTLSVTFAPITNTTTYDAMLAITAVAGQVYALHLTGGGTPLHVVLTPMSATVPCTANPGLVVVAVSTTGGDGNPVTFSISGGDTIDFALSGANIVVGPQGLISFVGNCGPDLPSPPVTETVTVEADQP